MNRNTVVLFVVALTVSAMIYAGAYKSRQGGISGEALSGEFVGKQAPDFELSSLEGKPVKLSDFRGRPVLLNFWATWCGPCKIEMPWFVEFKKRYEAQGFEIVGVAMEDTSSEEIKKFTDKMGINYVMLRGKEAVGTAYGGVQGLPASFYIDRNGKIVAQHAGLIDKSKIEEHIKLAIGEGK
ncbi:MAG TPA: redoxin domain-containing protein [Terriglobales bacterium]|nr:redoxin domain-containing protein [Terriglobales bacterium]